MPSIITDDVVKEMCKMSRPIPLKAIGVLNPNRKVGSKPNYMKRGRTGIKPVELPTYAPASVNSLVKSICNITKLEPDVVEQYLEKKIDNELSEYTGAKKEIEIQFDADQMANYEDFIATQTGSAYNEPIELSDAATQTRGAGRPPNEERTIIPGTFESAGDVDVEYPEGTANVGEDTTRPRGRPAASSMITPTPRLRGGGEPEL